MVCCVKHTSISSTNGLTWRARQVENDARAGAEHWALVKGAPEVVRGFLRSPPADYDATYRAFAAQGGRCALDKMRYVGQGERSECLCGFVRCEFGKCETFIAFAAQFVFYCVTI